MKKTYTNIMEDSQYFEGRESEVPVVLEYEIFIPISDIVLSNLLLSRRPSSRHKQFKKNFVVSNPLSLLLADPVA
jgi:hypothetical protein